MINKPGTLLVVRKKLHKASPKDVPNAENNIGITVHFTKDPKIYGDMDSHGWDVGEYAGVFGGHPYVHLPYGAVVLLLSIEPRGPSHGKAQKIIRVLYNSTYLVGIMSDRQINAAFTFPATWIKYYENGLK